MKKITAFLFCLMLVIASVAIQTDSIYAATRMVTVVMPDGGGTFQVEAEEVAADATEWGSEGTQTWLYIAEDIDNSGKDIKVHGDVHLILGDNTTYRCSSLILDGEKSNITFYSQSYGEGMGTFIADKADGSPAIGPNYEVNRCGGDITVYGGNIKATRKASSLSAVIGCDSGSGDKSVNMGTITINGGNVTVKSETTDTFCGSAIGTGWKGYLEKIVINGGNIDAESQRTAAAIGGSYESYSGIAGGAIELNGGNIKAYASGNNAAAFGGEGDSWTIVSRDNAPISSCYWYMAGGNNRLDRNNIDELGDNHYVEISRKENLKHSYSERFPVVQPEFDEGGTLVNAGCKAYFKCACGNYYVDCACTGSYDEWIADNYIGNTEEELNAWKSGDGRLEEKCSADYLCYENGEMKAKSQDSFYNLSYDGACVCGTTGKTTWYYINKDVEFGYNMEVRGDVRIILGDDVTADFTCGLNIYTAYSSLTIYAQSEGDKMGRLIASGCDNSGAACIGGNGTAGARIRIDGGNITAESDGTRVGIGDGNYPASYPSVTINGGIIKARGHGGPAIGYDTAEHGWSNRSCTVTINGGTIDAVSYEGSAAAIGSAGCYQTGVTINGGNITALSNGDGVAIGCSPVAWYECTPVIRHCLFDTVAGESAETAEKCDYTNQCYVKMTRLAEPVTHKLKTEYPMWAPRFNGDNTLAEAGCRDYYQCMCGYYYSDSELTKRISNLNTWKNDASVNGGKLDHAIHQSNEPTCSEGGYKEYYSKGKLYFSDEACTESIENLRAWKIKGGAGYLAPLKHDFTYTADGNVLTGTCTRDCCDLADNKATLTIIGDEYAYDGKAKTPEIVNSGWDASIPEIDYKGTGETHYSGRTAPKDVGTYSASITVDGVTASTEFSILDNPAVKELEELLKEATSNLESANKEIEDLNTIVTKQEQTIEEKTKELADKSNELKKITETLEQTKAELEQKSKELEAANSELDSVKQSMTELQGLYDQAIENLENANKEIENLNAVVNDQNKTIEEKTQTLNEITETLAQTKAELEDAVKRAEEAEAKLKLVLVDSVMFDLASSKVGASIKSINMSEFVVGGQKPYTFRAEGLPKGISISEEGILSGKYSAVRAAGTATIRVTDANDNTSAITIKCGKIVPATATIKSITSGKRKMTVKMTTKPSSKGASYYQIAYKRKGTSTWHYITTSSYYRTVKSLKKGKQYYVKVRAYKSVSGTKYYSAWTKIYRSKKIK